MVKQPVAAEVLSRPNRRSVLKLTAAGLALPAYLRSKSGFAAGRKIKIGYLVALSGGGKAFSETDQYVIDSVKKLIANGVQGNAGTFDIEFIVRDNKSNGKAAVAAATDLMDDDGVDMMIPSHSAEIVAPVSTLCEYYELPCISSINAWESFFFGRNGKVSKGFDWTYHFYWGLDEVFNAFVSIWDKANVEKVIGGLFTSEVDGKVYTDQDFGWPPRMAERGYRFVNPGLYAAGNKDFTPQISAFKEQGVEIVTGLIPAGDFIAFWKQCGEQGFNPKIATFARALLFPSTLEAVGDRGDGVTCGVSWAPIFPFKSGLTGETCQQLADGYTAATGRAWSQPLGYKHALLEVAIDVLKRADDPTNRNAIKEAMAVTDYDSIVGKIKWGSDPVKNASITPIVGGQWKKGPDGKMQVIVIDNSNFTEIPVAAPLSLLS